MCQVSLRGSDVGNLEDRNVVKDVLINVLGVKKGIRVENAKKGEGVECNACDAYVAKEDLEKHMASKHVLDPAAKDLQRIAEKIVKCSTPL